MAALPQFATLTDLIHESHSTIQQMSVQAMLHHDAPYGSAADHLDFWLIKVALRTTDISDPDYVDYMLLNAVLNRAEEIAVQKATDYDSEGIPHITEFGFMRRMTAYKEALAELTGGTLMDIARESRAAIKSGTSDLTAQGAADPLIVASWERVTNAIQSL